MGLDSVEWAAKYVYLAQVENFKSRELTDQEVVVMKWMEKAIQQYREKLSHGS